MFHDLVSTNHLFHHPVQGARLHQHDQQPQPADGQGAVQTHQHARDPGVYVSDHDFL